MKQSKLSSLKEATLNTLAGFFISLAAQMIFLPMLGVPIKPTQNLAFAVIMTFVSIGRTYVMRRIFEALHIRKPMSPAMLAVIAERHRQKEVEGWDEAHDDAHAPGDLARAGAAYLMSGTGSVHASKIWPWSSDWWKPDTIRPRRDLVRGLALGLAELEKLDRTKVRRGA